MAFKPNYGRDRAERARAARARSEEKKRKKDEKTALRKAQRADAESRRSRILRSCGQPNDVWIKNESATNAHRNNCFGDGTFLYRTRLRVHPMAHK